MTFDPLSSFEPSDRVRVCDGGTGSLLMEMGFTPDKVTWGAGACVTHPELVARVHQRYVDAGADLISTNTYQANLLRLTETGDVPDPQALIQKAVDIARSTVGPRKVNILGSVGPFATYRADASEYSGVYLDQPGFDIQKIKENYTKQATALKEAGCGLLLFETIPSVVEARIAAEVLNELQVDGIVSASCKDELHLNHGEPFADFVAALGGEPRVRAVGINCTSPRFVQSLLRSAQPVRQPHVFFMVYPNSGETYDQTHGRFRGQRSADLILDELPDWVELGCRIIGGCCRLGPDEIKGIRKKVDSL